MKWQNVACNSNVAKKFYRGNDQSVISYNIRPRYTIYICQMSTCNIHWFSFSLDNKAYNYSTWHWQLLLRTCVMQKVLMLFWIIDYLPYLAVSECTHLCQSQWWLQTCVKYYSKSKNWSTCNGTGTRSAPNGELTNIMVYQ